MFHEIKLWRNNLGGFPMKSDILRSTATLCSLLHSKKCLPNMKYSTVLQKENSEQYQGIQIPNPSASSYVRYSSKLTFKTIIVPEGSKNVASQTLKSVTY